MADAIAVITIAATTTRVSSQLRVGDRDVVLAGVPFLLKDLGATLAGIQ